MLSSNFLSMDIQLPSYLLFLFSSKQIRGFGHDFPFILNLLFQDSQASLQLIDFFVLIVTGPVKTRVLFP